MKTKFYLLTTFVFIAITLSAQRYQVMSVDEWNLGAKVWINSLRTTNTFDANGNLTTATTEEWNPETNVWSDVLIIFTIYNNDSTNRETLTQALDSVTNQMVDAFKTLYTYSATKNVLTETTQVGLAGTWIDFIKITNTYNESDQLIRTVIQVLNPLTVQLINADQTTYTYNADGTENQNVLQAWNEATGEWENSERNTHTYNDSKQITRTLGEAWVEFDWVEDSRFTFTYNEDGSITESVEENWVDAGWVNASKEMFTYNEQDDLEQIISQVWNSELTIWENELRIRYDYGNTGIDPLNAFGKVSIFPNPFKDQLTIQSVSLNEFTVQVFNANGQLMKSFQTNGTATNLDLGQLKSGVYFMKIKSAENQRTIKLLKTR